ncbi:MAG TPA: hypothetical protein DCX41_00985 [Aequorivita sp.]|nr:hypothetical protein [Aequorivita sp.]|tara:strand:+ start:305 stop:916 length:612 start_codon:yes stop_codon:yes gene_type:complete
MQQTKLVLRELFNDQTAETLNEGILLWLRSMEDSEAYKLYMNIPEILEEGNNSITDFLEAKMDFPSINNKQILKTVGLAMLLMFLLSECWRLFGKRFYGNPEGDWPNFEIPMTMKVAITLMPLEEFQLELAASMLNIVGKPYYDRLLEQITIFDIPVTPKQRQAFENDPILKKHLQLVMWFTLMRIFLDAIYFYTEKDNGVNP